MGLATLMFAAHTNLLAGLLMVVTTTACAGNFDPITHRVGEVILTFGPLQGIYRYLFDLPVLPWTGLNNTVVVGGLILGGVLFLPTYYLSRRLCQAHLSETCG